METHGDKIETNVLVCAVDMIKREKGPLGCFCRPLCESRAQTHAIKGNAACKWDSLTWLEWSARGCVGLALEKGSL